MLEFKNITKIYKSKRGVKTTALNNVNLKFGNKGMVFVLGKSGSGKSTLLNILGGLDKYNSGEIIINGKSSKTFKQKDFDSYRNTYIGFVFQEFNILEDFTVYRNISLALELQKKHPDKSIIEQMLAKVDLSGLENRRSNELSGGQKQRVAIARALVKDPDIILADEPTGNLDSETGTQIFELLKDLSKDKLVVVVSHDAESAKKYADRIIEFKDGVVISDIDNTNSYEITESFKTITSKLPFKESFMLGLGSLNNKKIRLAFTIILTSAALFFLGMSDTISSFSISKSHAKLMQDNQRDIIKLVYEPNYMSRLFSETATSKIKEQIDTKLYPVYNIRYNNQTINLNNLGIALPEDGQSLLMMGGSYEIGLMEISDSSFIKDKIIGRLPETHNEVMIPKIIAYYILEYGLSVENEFGNMTTYKPTSYKELISDKKLLSIGSYRDVTIVGIVDQDISKYEKIKNWDNNDYEDSKNRKLVSEFASTFAIEQGFLYVKEGFVSSLNLKESVEISNNLNQFFVNYSGREIYSNISALDTDLYYYDGDKYVTTNKVESNKVIIGTNLFNTEKTNYFTLQENYISKELIKDPTLKREDLANLFLANYVEVNNVIGSKIKIQTWGENDIEDYIELEIIGVYSSENQGEKTGFSVYVPREHFKDYIETSGVGAYYVRISNMNEAETIFTQYEGVYDKNNDDKDIAALTIYSNELSSLEGVYTVLSQVAFYTSLVFFVFSTFLLTNFIALSITYRKKEIGILRAIGARAKDVLSIFIWEGVIIGTISLIIAIIASLWVSAWLNSYISNHLLAAFVSSDFKAMIFTIRQFGLLVLVVSGIVFVASLIPTLKISRMKPIDAILNK